MYVIDTTVIVTISCDTCGTPWGDPDPETGSGAYSHADAATAPWRADMAADGWTITDGVRLLPDLTVTRVTCPACAAGRVPALCCQHCGGVVTRTAAAEVTS